MKIRTRLIVIVVAAVSVLIGVTCAHIWLISRTSELNRQEALVREITFDVFQGNQLRNEYFVDKRERSKQQWIIIKNKIDEQVNTLTKVFSDTHEKDLAKFIVLHKDTARLFDQLDAYGQSSNVYDAENNIREMIINQMMGESHRLYQQSYIVTKEIDRQTDTLLHYYRVFNFVSIGLLALIIITSSMLVMRSISTPLKRLREGTRAIAGGHFDHKLGIISSDEIGELAEDFNQMTEQLAKITVSRNDLLREREKRASTETALRQSEEQYGKLFAEAPIGIALIDSQTGQIFEVNPMFVKITGGTMEEMLQISWMSIANPDDTPEDRNNLELLNDGKISGFQMEKRYLHQDGTAVWITMTIASMNDDDKAHPCHLCMIEDITKRKQAEEALRQKAEALRASNSELELFNRAAVGRELRMIELKEEINELCRRLGEPHLHETGQLETDRVPGAGQAPKETDGGDA